MHRPSSRKLKERGREGKREGCKALKLKSFYVPSSLYVKVCDWCYCS